MGSPLIFAGINAKLLTRDILINNAVLGNLRVGNQITHDASTSITSGGILSINADTTKFNLTAGRGRIVTYTADLDNPVLGDISWNAFVAVSVNALTTQNETFILLGPSGNLIQQSTFPTPAQRRINIFIGRLGHSTRTAINNANSFPDFSQSISDQVYDLLDSLGQFNIGGNLLGPNGSSLTFSKTLGSVFFRAFNYPTDPNSPHTSTTPATAPTQFFYNTRNTLINTPRNLIDPANYDVNGVITPIPAPTATNATVQRVFLSPNNIVNIQYGQTIFPSLSAAVAGINSEIFIQNPGLSSVTVLIGYIVVTAACSSLSDNTSSFFVKASKFETGTSGSGTGGGGSTTATLQTAYNASVSPQIVLTPTVLGLTITDFSSPISGPLLRVTNFAGIPDYIKVTASQLSTTNQTFLNNNTASSNSGTGALTVGGGVGVGGALWVDSEIHGNNGLFINNGANFFGDANSVFVSGSIPSTNENSGALIVSNGGLGVKQRINAGGDITTSSNTASTGPGVGALVVVGGASIGGALNVGGVIKTTSTVVSTTTATGAAIVAGGVGIGGRLNVGGDTRLGSVLTVDGTIVANSNVNIFGQLVVNSGSTVAVSLTLSSTTDSTAVDNGALVVFGGTGIAKNLNVGGIVKFTNGLNTSGTTNGALVVSGGIGVAGNVFLGGTLTAQQNIVTQTGQFTGNTTSTSTSTGAVVVTGGVGIGGALNVGGLISTSNLAVNLLTLIQQSVTPVSGGAGTNRIYSKTDGQLYWLDGSIERGIASGANIVTLSNPAVSSSTTTGALIVTGGVGVGGALNVTGSINASSLSIATLLVTASTISNNPTTGALVVTGGVGIGGNLNVGGALGFNGALNIPNNTTSVSPSTGALTVAGGVGIGGNLNVGSDSKFFAKLNIVGDTSIESTTAAISTISAALVVSGGVGIGGNIIVGSIKIDGGLNIISPIGPTLTLTIKNDFGDVTLGGTNVVPASALTNLGTSVIPWNNIFANGIVTFGSNLNVGGNISAGGSLHATGNLVVDGGSSGFFSGVGSTSTTTGAVVIYSGGGIGVTGSINVGADSKFLSATNSTTPTTGALVITGGVGIGANLNVGGSVNISTNLVISTTAGIVDINGTTESTTTTTGAVHIDGGLGVVKQLNVGGTTSKFTAATASSSPTTGALVVTGGVGIGGALQVGGLTTINSGGANSTVFPGVRGTSGQFLTTNGAGTSTWAYPLGANILTGSFSRSAEVMVINVGSGSTFNGIITITGSNNGSFITGTLSGCDIHIAFNGNGGNGGTRGYLRITQVGNDGGNGIFQAVRVVNTAGTLNFQLKTGGSGGAWGTQTLTFRYTPLINNDNFTFNMTAGTDDTMSAIGLSSNMSIVRNGTTTNF